MQPIRSRVDPRAEDFTARREANLKALGKLERALAKARLGGGEKYNARHLRRDKLLPRERIERLLDPDSYFLEIAPLAAHGIRGAKVGAGLVCGIGRVSGVECAISANESTVRGGAINEYGVLKGHRLADIAVENRLPSVSLVESGGADLPNQSKIFVPGGRTFRDITRRSKARIPSVSLVFGNCTAGGAYLPGMSDYVVMVRERAKVFLAGPPLVKMATGEVIRERERERERERFTKRERERKREKERREI